MRIAEVIPGAVFPVAVAVSLVASSAFAINRYKSTQYSCADLKAIVQQQGEVILQYPPFGSTSTVYSGPDQCQGSVGDEEWVPTPFSVAAADTWFCSVGYVCEEDHHH